MKKLYYLIALALILGLTLTGCTLLSNIGQAPATEQSGITYLTKNLSLPVLVGLWHFDEGEGDTAYDSSGTILPNDGTVYGADCWVDGKFGKALSFNGLGDYVNCGSGTSLKPTQNITIEMWVKPNSTQNQYADILGGHQHNQGYVVQQDSTEPNNYYFAYNNDGTGGGWQGMWIKTQLTSDVWQHFVVQKEGSTIRHFLNGTLSASGTVSGDIWYSPIEPFYIGIGWLLTSSRYFEGSIDEVRIWDGALTEAQIEQSYALGTAQPEATVVELGQEFFGDEVVIFTSSFYGLGAICPELDTIDIYMMSNYGEAIEDVSARKKLYTPNNTAGCTNIEEGIHEGTSTSVGVGTDDCKSIHLSLDLTSGRSVGFNAQFLPYD